MDPEAVEHGWAERRRGERERVDAGVGVAFAGVALQEGAFLLVRLGGVERGAVLAAGEVGRADGVGIGDQLDPRAGGSDAGRGEVLQGRGALGTRGHQVAAGAAEDAVPSTARPARWLVGVREGMRILLRGPRGWRGPAVCREDGKRAVTWA